MSNNINTPRLRFPEFSGEWEEKKLGEVFSRLTEKNAEDNKNVLTISAQYGLISQLDFYKKSVSAADVTGYYLLHKGDFAYNKSSSQGKPVGVIKPLKLYDKGVVSTLYICFRCKDSNAIGFWEQYFDAGILDKEIMSIAQEGARNHGLLNVPTSDFFDLKVLMPSSAEQEKIAECLTEMDNLISAQAQKVDALKEKKKGLMQQLFPQPGQSTPQLRFPGFTGEWEEKKLGECFDKINNGMAYDTYLTEGFPMSRIETISSGIIDFDRVGYSGVKPDEKYKLIEGDILFSHINSVTRIGRIALYRGEKLLYHGMNLLLLRTSSQYDSSFMYYLMDRIETRTIIQRYAKKAINQASVSTSDIKRVSVMIPQVPAEQQKIAECLSGMDALIAAESAKEEALKSHKKGLMQQLFPQTGK